jgi:hypothetical protein
VWQCWRDTALHKLQNHKEYGYTPVILANEMLEEGRHNDVLRVNSLKILSLVERLATTLGSWFVVMLMQGPRNCTDAVGNLNHQEKPPHLASDNSKKKLINFQYY